MKYIKIIILLLAAIELNGQSAKKELKSYLIESRQIIDPDQSIQLADADYEKQYFFYGFIHGSQKTQEIDLQLLKSIKTQNGLKYYAPEVDFSMAYFLNKYLDSGSEDLLKELVHTYRYAVPQDASVAFFEKFRKLKTYNDQLPNEEKIIIIGTDRMISAIWFLRHLQELLPENLPADASLLSKLKEYPESQLGHFTFYDKTSELYSLFSKNWDQLYENDEYRTIFGEDFPVWNHLIYQVSYFFDEKKNREKRIFDNFRKLEVIYELEDQPVYFNFGYAHVLQAEFFNYSYLANRFKNQYSPNNVLTVLAIMSESNVLWNTKVGKYGKYKGYGVNWFGGEGDSVFERVTGISTFKKVTPGRKAAIYHLDKAYSPFQKNLYAIYTKKQLKNLKTESVTTDFAQYLIHIRHSKANVPIQEIM